MRWEIFTVDIIAEDVTGSGIPAFPPGSGAVCIPTGQSFTAHPSNVCSSPAPYPRGDACCNHFCSLAWLLISDTELLPQAFTTSTPASTSPVFSLQSHVVSLLPSSLSCTHICNSQLFAFILPGESFPDPALYPHYLQTLHLSRIINSPF